jgi:hypothetical protein
VVEQKAVTKEWIKCSPDDMDAVNLAYTPVLMGPPVWQRREDGPPDKIKARIWRPRGGRQSG